MKPEELAYWADDFEAFHKRFAGVFARSEPRAQAAKYMRGLMSAGEHRNGWQVAEVIGDRVPDRTQRLFYRAHWDADAARDILQRFNIETFGDAEGIAILDETGFVKKGNYSAGVQRQYCGVTGRVANCQVGTFLTYTTVHGHVFLDRRLYLPQAWCRDRERRAKARIPAALRYQSKPVQAMAMLRQAWKQGVPMRWVVGDEVYGNSTPLRDLIRKQGKWYVLAVPCDTSVWGERPVVPELKPQNPRRTRTHLAAGIAPCTTVAALVSARQDLLWERQATSQGEKGPRCYDWTRLRVVERRGDRPGPDAWLLVRRAIDNPAEIAYYLSNAPQEIPWLTLAQVASARFTVEQCLEEGKGEAGLDLYAVRYWPSWYRHITLSMMAHSWLASLRKREGEKPVPGPRTG